MKSNFLVLGMAVIALGFTSCKDEKAVAAQKQVDTYVVYVDSIGNVAPADAKTNWEAIDAAYQMRAAAAEAAMADLKEKDAAQERINASRAKYEALKASMEAEAQADKAAAAPAPSPKQTLRNTLFGEGKIGEDMSFAWVNKDNIHAVYQQFVHTAEDNKDKYSREDWDEVKLLWEALDNRKNTVEKEGLSSEDNRKIASLKIKFAPMLKVNRMGAKGAETKAGKE